MTHQAAGALPQATVYTTTGQALGVPLPPPRLPEPQLQNWLQQRLSADRTFAQRVRLILLRLGPVGSPTGGSPAGMGALVRFLSGWKLAGRFRVVRPGDGAAGANKQEYRAAEAPTLLGEILAEAEQEIDYPTSMRRLGRVGLSILGLATNPGPDAMPVRDLLTAGAEARAQQRTTENNVRDNAAPPRPLAGGSPPRPGVRVPLQRSVPFPGWPPANPGAGRRSR